MRKFFLIIFNHKRRIDYVILCLYALAVVILSYKIGAFNPIYIGSDKYRGYMESFNWSLYFIQLPLALFILRMVARSLGSGGAYTHHCKNAPLVKLFSDNGSSTEIMRNDLARTLTAPSSLYKFMLIATIVINFLDIHEIISIYSDGMKGIVDPKTLREKDWTVIFVTGSSSINANLTLVMAAYIQQIMITFIGLTLIAVIFRHNMFFLKRIYQRIRSGSEAKSGEKAIDIEDPEHCFGFREAHPAFNIQISCLIISGLIILVSRLNNIDNAQASELYRLLGETKDTLFNKDLKQFFFLQKLFSDCIKLPDSGQWIMASCWLILLLIVSMPSFVKLLPTIYRKKLNISLVEYLNSFLPDSILYAKRNPRWTKPKPNKNEVDQTALDFATNSFWPSGDTRAKFLFFFSFFVFLIILFPINYMPDKSALFIGFMVFLSLLAIALTGLFILFLKFPLWYVDPRLIKTKS
jgi:hypothetical protein